MINEDRYEVAAWTVGVGTQGNLCILSVLDQANERMSSCSGLSTGLILVWVLDLTWSEARIPIERIDVRFSHPHLS